MRIGLYSSNAALAEYFVSALGMADHTVTLFAASQDLASLQEGAPQEVLLLELILDERGRQTLSGLKGLAKDLGVPFIVLTTAGLDAIVCSNNNVLNSDNKVVNACCAQNID
jgi:DNA-binding response OmpR family regulator